MPYHIHQVRAELTYLGVSCIHVRLTEKDRSISLLLDPYLNEAAYTARKGVKGIEDLPLYKQVKVFQEKVGDAQALGFLEHLEPPEIILISHGHVDHMAHAAAISQESGAVVVGGKQVLGRAVRMGLPLQKTHDIRPHESLRIGDLTIETYPERHNPNALSDLCQQLLNLTPADSELGHMGYRFHWKGGPALFHAGDGARPEGFPAEDAAVVMLSVDAARGAKPADLLPALHHYGCNCYYLSMHRFYDAKEQNKILRREFGQRTLIPKVGETMVIDLPAAP